MPQITKSRKVEIKPKPLVGFNPKMHLENPKNKLGAKFDANGKILRPLTFEEEKILLKPILNIDPKSERFETEVGEYWKDIAVIIPEEGKTLETGLICKSKDDVSRLTRLADGNVSIDEIKGIEEGLLFPINPADYIVFRFALKHSLVANSLNQLYNSNKIRFYLSSKEMETNLELEKIKNEDEAYEVYRKVVKDKNLTRNILVVFDYDYISMTDDEKQIKLKELSNNSSKKFVTVATDKGLMMHCFINLCVKHRLLELVPNTEQYREVSSGSLLGTSLKETIGYLESPKPENQKTFNNLQAALNIELIKLGDEFKIEKETTKVTTK